MLHNQLKLIQIETECHRYARYFQEDSFNQLTIAELEKVLLCNNFNLK
jgi:hypothetical protein